MNDSLPEAGELRADHGSRWLCALADIAEGAAFAAEVASTTGGFALILLRVGDQVRAYHNECPHAGRRLDWAPGQFLIDQGYLICSAHGAAFTLDAGRCIAGPCRGQGLVPFPVCVRDGNVYCGR